MTEMDKLVQLLNMEDIPFQVRFIHNTKQVCYPAVGGKCVCDAVCHKWSYGYDEGLLEIMGLVEDRDDDVEGWLSAFEVFRRIKNHYLQTKAE